jgi:hypothetical protein
MNADWGRGSTQSRRDAKTQRKVGMMGETFKDRTHVFSHGVADRGGILTEDNEVNWDEFIPNGE